jgi:E3 ubiquitin-protein ligase MARCH6
MPMLSTLLSSMYTEGFGLPYSSRVSDRFTEIPAEMLFFEIFIPFLVEHCRPRATMKSVPFHRFSTVG